MIPFVTFDCLSAGVYPGNLKPLDNIFLCFNLQYHLDPYLLCKLLPHPKTENYNSNKYLTQKGQC